MKTGIKELIEQIDETKNKIKEMYKGIIRLFLLHKVQVCLYLKIVQIFNDKKC